ncbi:MAG: hypothetical protein ACLP7J_27270, partial [Streptosporangiaceae bacterium]
LAGNLNNKPAARNDHTAQPGAEPTLSRFALKPLALRQALPFPMALRVILADAGCAAKLQQTMNSNGDYLNALPGGCTVAAAVRVEVTTP